MAGKLCEHKWETSATGLGLQCHVVSSGHGLPCQISQGTGFARSRSTPAENNSTSSGCCGNIDNVSYTDKVTATDFYQKRHNSSLIKLI